MKIFILYICMYVCNNVCIYVSMYLCMCVCVCVCMCLCMYMSVYVCVCVCVYVCMCVGVCVYVCVCVRMYVCRCVCMPTSNNVSLFRTLKCVATRPSMACQDGMLLICLVCLGFGVSQCARTGFLDYRWSHTIFGQATTPCLCCVTNVGYGCYSSSILLGCTRHFAHDLIKSYT